MRSCCIVRFDDGIGEIGYESRSAASSYARATSTRAGICAEKKRFQSREIIEENGFLRPLSYH